MTAFIVVDLGFGDAGKGTITDFLVRTHHAPLVVRYNGGAQAGHHVVAPDGREHTFSQFGAGIFTPGVRTHLAESVVVHPSALVFEARHLDSIGISDSLERLSVSPAARVTTPFHQAVGRLRELARGPDLHGSVGVGLGETVHDSIFHSHDVLRAIHLLESRPSLRRRIERIRDRLRAAAHELCNGDDIAIRGELELLDRKDASDIWIDLVAPSLARLQIRDEEDLDVRGVSIVLEGAQGVLLDENWGFHPHTTWTTCTTEPAMTWLERVGYDCPVQRIGVIRTYMTRHGAGPFPSEARELASLFAEPHNEDGGIQGAFRRGWPDPILWSYAIRANGGIDSLAVTHLDRVPMLAKWKFVAGYENVSGQFLEGQAFLRLGPRYDLEYRTALTQALRGAAVRLDAIPGRSPETTERDYLEWLVSGLGVRVAILSRGPRATDKAFRATAPFFAQRAASAASASSTAATRSSIKDRSGSLPPVSAPSKSAGLPRRV